MENTNAYSHLTLEERRIMLKGITNGSTKTAIAQTIGKDKSTVGKEIKAHRVLVKKCPLPLECSAYRKCIFDRQCTPDCPDYTPFRCSRRDRFPDACNGCADRSRCCFDKYEYNPEKAQAVYRETLQDSRVAVNLTSAEAKAMADIIGLLLCQVRRSNAKTISLVRSKNPLSFFQLIPNLQCCKPINCCFIFLSQPGQALLLVSIVFVMPFFQDCLYLRDQLLLVWHIEDIAGCKDIVG